MIVHEMEQGTPEWFAVRLGKMTASEATCIAANGKGLETYIYKVVVGKHTGVSPDTFAGNRHTERGKELEPEARVSYEISRDVTVKQVGFIEYDEYLGCSPDGLVGEDGGLEIKCPDDVKYFKLMINTEKPDEDYIWQCQLSLKITGRKYWDLCFYNDHFEKSMVVFRIEPEMWRQEKLEIGIAKGKRLIQELSKKVCSR